MNTTLKQSFLYLVIATLIVAGVFVFYRQQKTSPQKIAERTVNYINANKQFFGLTEDSSASLIEVIEESGLYKLRLEIWGQEFNSYVTKDGKIFFPSGVDITADLSGPTLEEDELAQEVEKREVPDVKLFVMSYCPYGLQAQKMFLPVYDLLKDKVTMGVYFLDYIMHDKEEIDENLRQYCIEKEQKENYSSYLGCFVEDGDFEDCLLKANIDMTKLTACVLATDEEYNVTSQYNDESTWLNGYYPKFDVQADLNQIYGVRGSPTIVINDQIINVSTRSPENFKEVVCQAFIVLPEECSQILSSDSASAGFGLGTDSSGGGVCE